MKQPKIYSYYFPNWHVDKRNELYHGKGWTEWEVTKCARSRFEGHEQPRVPVWGYEDEADPKVMEKKIATAKKYGIDGFIFDTYYYDDGPHRERCLDEGFLGAKNSDDFEFAIMWCNHDHNYSHPAPRFPAPLLKSGAVTEKDFIHITNVFIEKYFSRPNYIRFDGKIFFIIFDVWKLITEFGGEDNAERVFKEFRQRVRDAGLGEMCLACVTEKVGENFDENKPEDVKEIRRILKKLDMDEGIRYWWPVKYTDNFSLTTEYEPWYKAGVDTFQRDQDLYGIPVNPNVMSGLDQSPRTIQSDVYENLNLYPWYSIVLHDTPELYEAAFRAAKKFASQDSFKGHYVATTWNEWTEGYYLEPDERYGYGYLEAIKRVLDEKE